MTFTYRLQNDQAYYDVTVTDVADYSEGGIYYVALEVSSPRSSVTLGFRIETAAADLATVYWDIRGQGLANVSTIPMSSFARPYTLVRALADIGGRARTRT